MKFLLCAAFAVIFAYAPAFAQGPSFEVASVRVDQGFVRESIRITPGALTIEGYSLSKCLEWAYNIAWFQIEGPEWVRNSAFTINAKAPAATTEDEFRLMLQKLLTERFAVRLHHDVRELPTYSMILVKGGPRFHDTGSKDNSKFLISTSTGPSVFTKDNSGLIAERATIAEVAGKLAGVLQRPTLDKTGLKERYDIRIDTTAYLNPSSDGEQQQQDRLSLIFNALQGQLGIKVEASKDRVDFLVIDSANQTPSEN